MWVDESFEIGSGLGTITGGPTQDEKTLSFVAVLRSEVGLYPPGLLERVGVQRFVLLDDLEIAGRPVAGLARRSTGSIFLDVGTSRSFRRMVVHHEIMHYLDASSPGMDRGWALLNPPGTKYGIVAASARNAVSRTRAHPGFLTWYALKNIGEDKAELFRWLVVHPEVVREEAAVDSVLAAKADYLMAQLESLEPGLDENWWSAIWAAR